jgi:hypothetical protein
MDGITLGQTISDHNKQMKILTKFPFTFNKSFDKTC